MRIELKEYGKTLGPRALGAKLKNEILEKLSDQGKEVIFVFDGLTNLSTGFAKELFGELYIELKKDFQKKVSFHFEENQDKSIFIQSINRGIKAAVENKNT